MNEGAIREIGNNGLLNNKYKPVFTLKTDPKGDVMKCLYFKNPIWISSCLVKQGRHQMCTDGVGRDMSDRIQWQNKMHNDLATIVPVPKILDQFTENKDSYLAMEYLKGDLLNHYILKLLAKEGWAGMRPPNRFRLIEMLFQIISLVEKFHEHGYVHRDIMPDNFIVGKGNRLYCVDLELTYSISSNFPDPPFTVGTEGFMSPEQETMSMPTFSQDIYSLGAMMIVFFTGRSPVEYLKEYEGSVSDHLTKLLRSEEMVGMITDCLHFDPLIRPTISYIRKTIQEFRLRLKSNNMLN